MQHQSVAVLLVAVALCLVTVGVGEAQVPEAERDALMALFESTAGDGWTDSSGWGGLMGSECTWFGVECDGANRVSKLNLPSNNLVGGLPPEIGALERLADLGLSANQLSGSIPPELGNLNSLLFLDLGDNELSGSIPPQLGNLGALWILSLAFNDLSGPIPVELANLTNLGELWLPGNQLSGSIPVELAELANLQLLALWSNQLTGEIPPELAELENLWALVLSGNPLIGSIPPELGSLPNLRILMLAANGLTGTIPAELGGLTSLTGLWLDFNQLTGSVPAGLSELPALEVLSVGQNQLTGSIPSELADLASLTFLDLHGNQLTGEIPPELAELSGLTWLNLGANQLTGEIPAELGTLPVLAILALDFNGLSGAIPEELGDLSELQGLYLHMNQLAGQIPPQLADLSTLIELELWGNRLSGGLPSELGGLTALEYLNVAGNRLTGSIPSSFSQLTSLRDEAGLDLRLNGLYTFDATLREFLDTKQFEGDWASTQTVPPVGVAVSEVGVDQVKISWRPIVYSWDAGGYRVLYSQASGGPFTLLGTTEDKTAAEAVVTGLDPATAYYFVVQTVTEPNEWNQNTVESVPSAEVAATTRSLTDCAIVCSAEVPMSAEVGEAVTFAGEATASNCEGDIAYVWHFGDGQAAQRQSPRRSYAAIGTYTWTLTASVEDQTCSSSDVIGVFAPGSDCGNGTCEYGETAWSCPADCGLGADATGRAGESATTSAVPAAAGGVGGVGGTFWLSEAMVYNPGSVDATYSMAFTPDDAPGESITVGPLTLGAEAALFAGNLVLDAFGVTSNGSVMISSDTPIMFVSRTYNDQPQGTYGQFLGAVRTSRALGVGDTAYLIGLSEGPSFRSNVLLQDVTGLATDVDVSVYSSDGAEMGTTRVTVPPSTKVQHRLSALGFASVDNGYATIKVVKGGQIVAIASVADQATGDAMTLDALHPDQVELAPGVTVAALRTGPAAGEVSVKVTDTVDFTWSPQSPVVDEQVQFSDQSSPTPSSWSWSFGDGSTSNLQNPSHAFNQAGTYQVSLSVASDLGTTFKTKSLTVQSVATSEAHYLVAVIARLLGAEGTVWRSDLWIMNPFGGSQQVRLEYRPVAGGVFREQVVVPVGGQVTLADVVDEVFSDAGDGKGSLHVYAPEGVFVHSRTYNLGTQGTFGQAIPALAGGDLLAAGETGVLLKLKSTADTRCNVGFTELDGEDTRVEVQLYAVGTTGITRLASRRYDVLAYQNLQVDQVFTTLGVSDSLEEALAYVEVIRGGRVYAYASNTDNRTGDSEFITAMRK